MAFSLAGWSVNAFAVGGAGAAGGTGGMSAGAGGLGSGVGGNGVGSTGTIGGSGSNGFTSTPQNLSNSGISTSPTTQNLNSDVNSNGAGNNSQAAGTLGANPSGTQVYGSGANSPIDNGGITNSNSNPNLGSGG